MNITDTHCHLYLPDFDEDRDLVIDRAEKEGVNKFYLPGIDSTVINPMLALENKYPGRCFATMGLHPCSVKENYEEELRIVEDWLQKRKFSAVGEIGLDFYWDTSFSEQQYDAFARQVKLARTHAIPIIIHSRNSTKECIDTVAKNTGDNLTGIFHCFSGTKEEAGFIIEMGFYLGIGGVITYKNSGLADVVASLPLEHIVLETDAPYLTPVPFRGKRNESSYLAYVLKKVSEVKNISPEAVAEITTRNAQKIFGN